MTQQVCASPTVPMTLDEIRQQLLPPNIKTEINFPGVIDQKNLINEAISGIDGMTKEDSNSIPMKEEILKESELRVLKLSSQIENYKKLHKSCDIRSLIIITACYTLIFFAGILLGLKTKKLELKKDLFSSLHWWDAIILKIVSGLATHIYFSIKKDTYHPMTDKIFQSIEVQLHLYQTALNDIRDSLAPWKNLVTNLQQKLTDIKKTEITLESTFALLDDQRLIIEAKKTYIAKFEIEVAEHEKLNHLLEKMNCFLPSIFLQLSTFTLVLPFAYLYFLDKYFRIKA